MNNSILYKDDTGEFLFAFLGALGGGLIGGIKSAVKGEGFWKGARSGAISGAITGAGVDITVATGGWGRMLIPAIAGAVGSEAGNISDQLWHGLLGMILIGVKWA